MVYVTGDMHGDFERFKLPAMKKLKKGDTLIICGDFGFLWDGSKEEEKILEKLSENFEMLNSFPVSEWNGGKVHHIIGSVYHLMRGQIFNIDGLRIFTMGGGESPDVDIRIANDTWYAEESPSQQELIEGAENMATYNNIVDIVITHEPSAKVKEFLQMQFTEKSRVTLLNTYFEELAGAVDYRKWYFGSLHMDKHISATQVAVFTNVLEAWTGKPI